jgi:hypothetical protein
MPIMRVHCPVSQLDVVRVTDLDGGAGRILCSDYDEPSRGCRLKARANAESPLARLLERAAEGTLASHDVRCELL